MKDNREIIRGVRIGGVVYDSGKEDELAEALDKSQLQALLEKGAITGDWAPVKTTKGK